MRIALASQYFSSESFGWIHDWLERRRGAGDQVTVVTGTKPYRPGCGGRLAFPAVMVPMPDRRFHSITARMLAELWFVAAAGVRALCMPRQDWWICLTSPPLCHWIPLGQQIMRGRGRVRIISWCMDCHPEIEERLGIVATGGVISRLFRGQHRFFASRIDRVITADNAARSVAEARYAGLRRAPGVTVIPNWESADGFPAGSPPSAHPYWRDSRFDGRLKILYAGNAGRGHDFAAVLEAAATLDAAASPAFVFSGGGHEMERLAGRKEELGLGNMFFKGYETRAGHLALVAGADVCLITMHSGLAGMMSPSKLYTALALGKPVLYVGPEAGNVDEAIRRHRCGFSIRNDDVSGVLGAIGRLRDDAVRRDLGVNSARAFREAYSLDAVVRDLDRILES